MSDRKKKIEELANQAGKLRATSDGIQTKQELFGEAWHELRLSIEEAMNEAKTLKERLESFVGPLDDYNASLVRCSLADIESMLLLASRSHPVRIYNAAASMKCEVPTENAL